VMSLCIYNLSDSKRVTQAGKGGIVGMSKTRDNKKNLFEVRIESLLNGLEIWRSREAQFRIVHSDRNDTLRVFLNERTRRSRRRDTIPYLG
jgi:hypothetical protein